MLFRKGNLDCVVDRDRLLCSAGFANRVVGDEDTAEVDAARVGILEFLVFRLFDFATELRLLPSLSNLRLTEMGDGRSDTLLRFGSGVTPGDEDLDALFFDVFAAVGVNFFNCSKR